MKLLQILQTIWLFFTPYVNPFERRTEKFFRWVSSRRTPQEIHEKLLALMQEDLLIFNIWLEKRFKNYRSLSKRRRRAMYRNAQKIAEAFEVFMKAHNVRVAALQQVLSPLGLRNADLHLDEIQCLAALAAYFDPRTRFHYQEQCAFGRLLVDPESERMTGDCNQIVTLYAWLFSRHFPLHDLQIKLIPGHVCLHYHGVDIEATNGTFQHYEKYDSISPITELVSTNLLDLNDPSEQAASIAPETFEKAAQLAYAISSKREAVEHNLQVAYEKLCLAALKQKNFTRAMFYAEKSRNPALKKACYSEEFNMLAKKVAHVGTIREAQSFQPVYRRMLNLAKNLGDQKNEHAILGILNKM
ncbi:MAG: hypothetical protein AAB588_05710 [Patescibacteria group bacterium]